MCNPKERTKYYNSFGAQLADKGYIVFAPQNPYIFDTHFRQILRKANPLKLPEYNADGGGGNAALWTAVAAVALAAVAAGVGYFAFAK